MSQPAFPQADTWLRRLGQLFVGLSLIVLATAYGAMSWAHGTPLLWHVAVHEDGHRTFVKTLFYVEHATRELPLDLLLGVVIGAGAAEALGVPRMVASRVHPALAAILLALVLMITAWTALQFGLVALRDNILQYHTREGAPLVWGAHWRYHLLERGPLMLLAFGWWGVVRAFRTGGTHGQGGRVAWIAMGAFIALSALFTPDLKSLSLPFTDVRYLGHQAREIFTHSLVTVPLSIGVLLLYPRGGPAFATRPDGGLLGSVLLICTAISCFAYVGWAAIQSDAASAGQSESIVTLLAPHFFEHGLTYLVTPLTAVLVFEKLRSGKVTKVRNVRCFARRTT